MANRRWFELIETQGVRHTYLPVTVLPQGNSTPKLGEGDPAGSYFTISRVAAGNLALTTVDAFPAVVKIGAEVGTGARVKLGIPVQNANNTWTFPIYTALDVNTVQLGTGGVTVTAGGSGYTSAPAITYNNAHGNVGLKGVVTISGGAVTAISITEGGLGSDGTAPTITLTGGGGSSATATVSLNTSNSAADLPVGTQIRLDIVMRDSSVTP